MSSAALNTVIQYLIGGISFLAILKLWRAGLLKRYTALFCFLLFFLIESLGVLYFSNRFDSPGYKTYWEIAQPLTWILSVWVVLELYSLILERHKGLATLGRWIQYAGFILSTGVSLLVMLPQIESGSHRSNAAASFYYPIERGVDCGMLVFLLFILFWLTQYPVPLSRNVVVHSFVYTALFFTNSLGLFAQMFFGLQLSQMLATMLAAIFGLCVLAWLVLLTPKGEEVRVRVPHFSAEHEAQVLEQLEALNRTLLKVSRN